MFSLIITIVSIALVAALALATIYYGGTAFSRGGDAARAAQHINEGQQINGAFTLARADAQATGTAAPGTLAALVTGNYLAQVPAGWVPGAGTLAAASVIEVTPEVCTIVNTRKGGSATFAGGQYGCVTVSAADATALGGTFVDGDRAFFFKN
jgi:hypothetical protein